ncbi:MAG: HEAT repeat domain-containing protein [bacterium]
MGLKKNILVYIFLAVIVFPLCRVYSQAGADKLYSEKIKKQYGKVSTVEKDSIVINLGWDDGIIPGMIFKVFDHDNNLVNRLEVKEILGNNISLADLYRKEKSLKIEGGRREVKTGYAVELEIENSATVPNGDEEIQLKRLKDKNLQVRVDAMDILARTGGINVIPEIIQILNENSAADPVNKEGESSRQNSGINLKRSASWALGEISFRVFSQIFFESKDKTVLDKEKEGLLYKVTNILIDLCSSPDKNISLNAARNIGRLIAIRQIFGLKNEFLLAPLTKILIKENDNYVKRALIDALAELKDERAVFVLLSIWGDKDPVVRANVSWALEKIGYPVVPFLKEIINDPDEEKRKEAVRVLFKLGYKTKKVGNKYEIAE